MNLKKVLLGGLVVVSAISLTGCKKINTENIEKKNVETNKKVSETTKNETIENLQLIDSNILLTSLGLEVEDVSDYVGKIPVYNRAEGTMYVAIKPAKNKKDKVKRALELYVSDLESKLTDLRTEEEKKEENEEEKRKAEELKLLKALKKEEYKGYFIYVSGKNTDQIMKILKERVK